MNRDKFKIGIYSPYFHIFGGGERYLLTIAEYLSRKNKVILFADPIIKEKAKVTFNIPLDRVHFLSEQKLRVKKLFDILFYMTDGSLFFSFSRKNYLIIQSPSHIPSATLINRLKLFNWKIICYSQFMQAIIEKRLNILPLILPPAIAIEEFEYNPTKKKNIILSVGRFFSHLHNKRHDFLIGVFKKYFQTVFKDWRLVIAGGLTDKNGEKVVENLKKQSQGYPIEILVNVSFDRLRSLYRQAKIYWHAAGFGEDIEKYPEKAEHFGITTLEAMAAGAVPLVYNAGGQTDIIFDGQNGYLWQTEEEFIEKNQKLLRSGKLLEELSKSAKRRSEEFSQNKFYEKLEEIIAK